MLHFWSNIKPYINAAGRPVIDTIIPVANFWLQARCSAFSVHEGWL